MLFCFETAVSRTVEVNRLPYPFFGRIVPHEEVNRPFGCFVYRVQPGANWSPVFYLFGRFHNLVETRQHVINFLVVHTRNNLVP